MQQDDQVGELSITLQEVIDIINNDLQEELGGVKRSQKKLGGVKRSQEKLGEVERSQEESGGVKRSQEESEGVNDLQ